MPHRDGEDSLIQGELDFESGNSDGFENWLRHQEEIVEGIRYEWSLPIGHVARVKLKGIKGELVGRLLVAEPPSDLDHAIPLQLRIDRVTFTNRDIEEWRLD